jgi:type IV pilus assembly protein PilV
MKAPRQTLAKQQGVLLIEVLISILIFSFAILGLVGMQAKALGFSGNAEDRNRAALLASDMVGVMWANQTVNATALSAQVAAWRTRVQAALPPYNSTVTATVGEADTNGVVAITISWTPADSSTAHTYTTKIAM